MIVADASAALAALTTAGPARAALGRQQVHAPYLVDVEVASGLRRLVLARSLTPAAARDALTAWQKLALTRHSMAPLLDRVWELRDNVSTYDASYIALSERLGCTLLTADVRLANAPGKRCPVTLVPR